MTDNNDEYLFICIKDHFINMNNIRHIRVTEGSLDIYFDNKDYVVTFSTQSTTPPDRRISENTLKDIIEFFDSKTVLKVYKP